MTDSFKYNSRKAADAVNPNTKRSRLEVFELGNDSDAEETETPDTDNANSVTFERGNDCMHMK